LLVQTYVTVERIKNSNKTYFVLQKYFRNKNIPKKLKLRLKNTIIDKSLNMHQKPGYYQRETGSK